MKIIRRQIVFFIISGAVLKLIAKNCSEPSFKNSAVCLANSDLRGYLFPKKQSLGINTEYFAKVTHALDQITPYNQHHCLDGWPTLSATSFCLSLR